MMASVHSNHLEEKVIMQDYDGYIQLNEPWPAENTAEYNKLLGQAGHIGSKDIGVYREHYRITYKTTCPLTDNDIRVAALLSHDDGTSEDWAKYFKYIEALKAEKANAA
jgi:hypothetical protein